MTRKIENIIIHCSESPFGDVDIIKNWHIARGFRTIGYNAVILNGRRTAQSEKKEEEIGILEEGRGVNLNATIDSDEIGAHALGYNGRSLGICLIGNDKFYLRQFETAVLFCRLFKKINPDIKVLGHCETARSGGKTCPNFDMAAFRICLLDSYKPIKASIVANLEESLIPE